MKQNARYWILSEDFPCSFLTHLFASIAFWCTLVLCTPVHAQNSMVQSSRLQRVTSNNGGNTGDLVVELRIEPSMMGGGYRRCHYRLSHARLGKFPNSGNVRLQVAGSTYSRETIKFETEHSIEIEQGSPPIDGSFLVRFTSTPSLIHYSTTLNGKFLSGNSGYLYLGSNTAQIGYNNLTLVSARTKSLSQERLNAYENIKRNGNWTDETSTKSDCLFGLIESMPENWLVLTNFNCISLDASDFLVLSDKQRELLNNYVLAGGCIEVQRAANL